ncbi:hypothetical protein GUITHDRAFT_108442 [Guillardia theta CCMP2712]|uniref:Uncharacterized protein n=1 Tax=Guillardia theta (strain CCMP2712) TaxID=905079 RepID=L1JBS2_GUITC|nr:hypothetical protein GUITHDRAFT_108442 [Guillardia theta CCMP2712]EKX45569.1 hypothetical protein GUITHDRAFT_108442 [Guillardia theta CCMP2712]|eukprot:XP_005832549.1 hypothetical protein GUITHDRAFT_108442 [Guillardia theta CCMP2712]
MDWFRTALVEINKKKIKDCAFNEDVEQSTNCPLEPSEQSSSFLDIDKFMEGLLETIEPSLEALLCIPDNSLNTEKSVNDDQVQNLKRFDARDFSRCMSFGSNL